ncbi:MAG: family 78 glycoside hydrolase catalytic domain [Clostridia bacterium]|nr:family 78 glycoside hydrolase catalytic domain [Clostridia bacterium]
MLKFSSLKTEYLTNPICVPLDRVRFSWEVLSDRKNQRQTAYQITVTDGVKTVWDSGKVLRSKTAGVLYGGEQLKPRTKYFWSVKVFGVDGEESSVSPVQTFETCLSNEKWESVSFIGAKVDGLPILRKSINLQNKKIVSARLYACGLGNYNLTLNGKPVSEELLNPMVTRYHNRYFYNAFDITNLLKNGENAFCVMLSNGYYCMSDNGVDWQKAKWANSPWADRPKFKMLAFVRFDDGTEREIITDESWKFSESPLKVDEAYYGEEFDARLIKDGWDEPNFDDSSWQRAEKVEKPLGKAEPQLAVGCAKICEMPLKTLYEKENEYLFDLEQMTAGWVSVSVEGANGASVEVSYSEWLDDKGEFDQRFLLGKWNFKGKLRQPQTDYFTLRGDGIENFAPLFQYKGFRYVRIRTYGKIAIKGVIAQVVYANLERTGEFSCSNEVINDIHKACQNSLLNNMHGYPSDTPVYEKMGYLADGYLTQEMAHYNFDATLYYEKWARDINDQAKDDGYLEQTAPMWDEDKENAPEWSVAIAVVPYQIYLQTGDATLLFECYDKAKKVFAYQLGLTKNYIATSMWGDHACFENHTIKEISATASLYDMANILRLTAQMQGKDKDAEYYTSVADKIKTAFNERFFDEKTGCYSQEKGDVTLNAQVIPYALGLVENDKKRLIGEFLINNNLDFVCGIFAVKYLFPVFQKLGLGNRLYEFATATTIPSWRRWLSFGDGSLWEQWDETRSRNHHMFGTIDEWFYKSIAGLNILNHKSIEIEPFFHSDLSWAKATVQTINGKAKCGWERKEKSITVNLLVPFNATAIVRFFKEKKACVFENGLPLTACDGVKIIQENDDFTLFEIGSGEYSFEIK